MANQLLTRQEITRAPLMTLENELRVLRQFYRDLDVEFGKKGGKIGETIYVRKPARFIGRDGQAWNPEGMVDTQVPITINQQSGVDFEFSTAEKYLTLDDFKTRYADKAAIAIANKLDYRCASVATTNIANQVGTPGTTPGLSSTDAFNIYGNANTILTQMGFPLKSSPRMLVLNSAMNLGWTTFAKAFFNPQSELAKQWKTGQVSNALGDEWFEDENINVQTIGALGGTPAVNGANQTGTALITDGWTATIAALLNVGDTIQITGVFSVNPQSRVSTGRLQDFVVQATAASDGGGNSTLTIMPAIVPSGQFQNVTNAPADNSLIQVYHTAAAGQGAIAGLASPQGLLLTKECMAFVSFPGDVPDGVDMGFEDRSNEIGVSLRFVRIFSGKEDMWITRYDVYYGMGPLYMEGGVRIAG